MEREGLTPDEAQKLREPFPPEQVGKLPKAGITLDYVGHAAVTDRLLQVDRDWTWEPMGRDEHGNPAIVSGLGDAKEPVCLWIKLTICGVTRPGFGSGRNAKEAIGDAIRNAAMRFGVALDLWAKEDLKSGAGPAPAETGQNVERTDGTSADGSASTPAPEPSGAATRAASEPSDAAPETPFKAPSGPRGGKSDALEAQEIADKIVRILESTGATDSIPKVRMKAEDGDVDWLKRAHTRARKRADQLVEQTPIA